MDTPTSTPATTHSSPSERPGKRQARLSIFARLSLGFLAIILVMGAVNLFALSQIRQIVEQSTTLVSETLSCHGCRQMAAVECGRARAE